MDSYIYATTNKPSNGMVDLYDMPPEKVLLGENGAGWFGAFPVASMQVHLFRRLFGSSDIQPGEGRRFRITDTTKGEKE